MGEMGKQGGKATRGAGGRGEGDRGKTIKLEVTGSEITYASCLKFFSVFAMFNCSLTTVMPKLFFFFFGYFLKRSAYQCFILAVSPGQTITTPSCETLTGKLPDLAQP